MVINVSLEHSASVVTLFTGQWNRYIPEYCHPMTIYVRSLFSK